MKGAEEEFVPEDEVEEGLAAIKKLREKLKKAVEEKQEYLDGWQRARADFANYRKEEAADIARKESLMRAEFVNSLLPALDSLELAIRHSPSDELKLVHKQFLDSLKTTGVERFGKAGEEFNPSRHEALGRTETSEKDKDHTIVSVERSGYSIGEKIIRPAYVIIATHG